MVIIVRNRVQILDETVNIPHCDNTPGKDILSQDIGK